MNHIIVEEQTINGSTAVVTPIPVYINNPVEAEAVFLEKCAAARRSGLPVHSVTLLDEEGRIVARKCYRT